MPNPKAIGENSEAQALARLLGMGKVVLLPFGNNQRYDLVIDEGGVFIRAQVKTGRLRNGVVSFRTCSTNGFTGVSKGYTGEADVFLVYCPENREVYQVPVAEVGREKAHLRVDSGKIAYPGRQATDYLLR